MTPSLCDAGLVSLCPERSLPGRGRGAVLTSQVRTLWLQDGPCSGPRGLYVA